MKKFVLIVAGGFGLRMESDIPKQFLELDDKPILMRAIRAFYKFDHSLEIIVVLPHHFFKLWNELIKEFSFKVPHEVVKGGETRYISVRNGLNRIKDDGLVAIHDGVRPLVSEMLIETAFREAKKHGSAVPAVVMNESVRIIRNGSNESVNRNNIRIIQTPQVFRVGLIKKAYEQDYEDKFTDDASVLEGMGENVHLIEGDYDNIKITRESDLHIAKALLKKR